jgi:hypothetical protein
MKRLAILLAAIALPLAATPVAAQFQPGLRAPETVRDGVSQSFDMGCYFAVTGRAANGLNIPLDTNGASLRSPSRIPDILRPFIDTLDDHLSVVVLDTPGGPVWTFFDRTAYRCLIVPEPAGAEGVEAELLSFVASLGEWREVAREGGGRAFEQDFEANPMIPNSAGRMRAWYQPAAGPASPQMIVVERVPR